MDQDFHRDLIGIRSRHGVQKCLVRFKNLSQREIDIVWISLSGTYVTYKRLHSRAFVDIDTYKGHPWIAFDHKTKERMVIDQEFIYYPKTTIEHLKDFYPELDVPPGYHHVELRIPVDITLPLYSLCYRTLLTIRNYLSTPDEVEQLDLPQILASTLRKLIISRNKLTQ